VAGRDHPPSVGSPSTSSNNDDKLAPGSVKLQSYSWRKGGFGTVILGTFTIENRNDFAIKDIDVVCQLTGQSGTVVGYTASTIYETVAAHSHKTVRELNMGSGVSVDFNQAAAAYCKLGAMSRN